MADYTIAPVDVRAIQLENVKPLITRHTSGDVITAGTAVAIDDTSSNAVPADATSEARDAIVGVALNDAQANQPIDVIQAGFVELGAVGIAGDVAVMSQSIGGIAPNIDLVTGNEVAVIGYFVDASTLLVDIKNIDTQVG